VASTAERRVLQLVVSTALGGGPKHVLDVVTRLDPRRFVPLVAGPPDGPMFARFEKAGIETHAARLDRLDPVTLVRLCRLARRRGVHLVHSHGKGAGVYGRLAARVLGVPAVHTFHGLHHESYGAVARHAYLGLERGLARLTRTIVNVTEAQERAGLALRLFRAGQSVVIENGVDVHALDALAAAAGERRRGNVEENAIVVGTVARLDAVKAVDVLLAGIAAARARLQGRPLVAVVVGAGREGDRLRARVASLGLDGVVRFPGAVEDAPGLFGGWDLYASASRVEGLPLALLEAMACRLPVVATDIPGHRRLVEHGVTGLLVPVDDAAALGDAIAVLARSAERPAMGEAGRRRVERTFTLAATVARLQDVYDEALAR
jgi:glycosyltransferase involved in cell wall biosynthesis